MAGAETMDVGELERYLHEHIPLSKTMGVAVHTASEDGVVLAAPLAPNINHRDTLFGGSACAAATLAAWTLIYARLRAAGIEGRVVIRSNTMHYDKPVDGDFLARAESPPEEAWHKVLVALKRRRMARLVMHAQIHFDGIRACEFEGEFVILP
jgi:thioesterase domain-containing protein